MLAVFLDCVFPFKRRTQAYRFLMWLRFPSVGPALARAQTHLAGGLLDPLPVPIAGCRPW